MNKTWEMPLYWTTDVLSRFLDFSRSLRNVNVRKLIVDLKNTYKLELLNGEHSLNLHVMELIADYQN